MLKYSLAVIFACAASLCVYAHHTDNEWGHGVLHSHPDKHCYGEIYDDGYRSGYIHKDHIRVPAKGANDNPDWHIHRNARKINELGVVAHSEDYRNQHRQFYCNEFKCGGPKPAQRVYKYENPEDDPANVPCEELQASPSAPSTVKVSPKDKLTITWASLKKARK